MPHCACRVDLLLDASVIEALQVALSVSTFEGVAERGLDVNGADPSMISAMAENAAAVVVSSLCPWLDCLF